MGIGIARRAALVLGTCVLGVSLAGSAAFAAFTTGASAVATGSKDAGAHAERTTLTERLRQVLDALVASGTITAAQRDEILAKVAAADEKQKKDRPAVDLKRAVAGMEKAALAFIGGDGKTVREQRAGGLSLAEIAISAGKTRELLIAAMVADANAKIDAAADLTAEQKTALKAEAATFAAKLADAKREPKVKDKEDDEDEGKRPDVSRVSVHAFIGGYLRTATTFIGLEQKAVNEQLRAGKSLAEIAVANGKTRDGLVSAITTTADPKIDARSGLTAEQKTTLRANVKAAVEKIVDAKGRAKGPAPKVEKQKNSQRP